MEVPGIRRVRSHDLPRRHRDLGPVRSRAPTWSLALQQVQNRVAEMRSELPADTELDRRAADARRLPDAQPQPDRRPADRRTCTTTPSTSCARRWRGCRASGRVEVLASDTREIEVVADPGAPARRRPDRRRRRRRAAGGQPRCRRSAATPPAACSTWCSPPALWNSADDIGQHAGRRAQTAPPSAWPTWPRSSRARPTAPRSSPATAARRRHQRLAAGRRQHPRRSQAGVEAALARARAHACPPACGSSKVYDLAEFVADRHRQRARRHPDRRRARGARAAASSCATGG